MFRKKSAVNKWCNNNPRTALFTAWYLLAAIVTFTVLVIVYGFKLLRGIVRLLTRSCDRVDHPVSATVVVEETPNEESHPIST